MSDDKDLKQHDATISPDEQNSPSADKVNETTPAEKTQGAEAEKSDSSADKPDTESGAPAPKSRVDVRKTQVLKRPKEASRSTFVFSTPKTPPKKPVKDPDRDTNILSRDNPMLRRAISQHAAGSGEDENGDASLGDTREVILLIRGMVERVVMRENVNYKLGRFELAVKGDDEIDLTPYGAQDRGVSRLHAQLHLEGEKLYITDLQSTNGTYLSGNRLESDTPTLLRKGDELLLGRLAIQVLFR